MDRRIQVIRIIRLNKTGLCWRTRVEVRRTYPWEDPTYGDDAVKYVIRDVKDEPQTIWTFVGPKAELDAAMEGFLERLREIGKVMDDQEMKIVHKYRDTYKPLHDALVATGLLVNQKTVHQRIAERERRRKAEKRQEDEARQETAQERLVCLMSTALDELAAEGVIEGFYHTPTPDGSVAFSVLARNTTLELIVKGTKRAAGKYKRSHPESLVIVVGDSQSAKRRVLKTLAEHPA